MYADVIFPIKLGPLTYRIPEEYGADLKGRIVSAPLANKTRYGLVVNMRNEPDAEMTEEVKNKIRDIDSAHEKFASENHLRFLQWISDYYLSPEGMVLKSSFFEEAVAGRPEPGKPRRKKKTVDTCEALPEETPKTPPPEIIDRTAKSVKSGAYSAFLYHAPDMESEYLAAAGILAQLADEKGGFTVLVPEISHIKKMAPQLREIFGERLAVLHARQSKKERRLAVSNIMSGISDVTLGTRSAMLAPLPQSRFIAVLEEHSPSYKAEEGSRYNARDLAVMKAYMDKSCVLLMSVCPSVESVYNARKGKYTGLNRTPDGSDVRRPRVKIVTHRPSGKNPSSLSSVVLNETRAFLRNHNQTLFLVGRKGYSLLRCEDCGLIESCPGCETSMVFYKKTGTLKCHHCGVERPAPETCPECGGASLSIFTAGVDRVREELDNFQNDPVMAADKALVSSPKNIGDKASGFMPYVIGAGVKKKKAPCEKYSAAVVMNIDLLAARPDFRANERAFQEILEVSQLVKPEGPIFIQTRSRSSKFLKLLRDYDFESFYEMELSQRRDISYPPFERIILLWLMSKSRDAITEALSGQIGVCGDDKVVVLGPVEAPAVSRRYPYCSQIILKSADHKQLRETAKKILAGLAKNKRLKVTVDVDPLKI
jgi:primosomal protein N' (replication factor Y) (superfamily II helicase)